jgi:GT2 family glycosyltransferase
MKWSNIPNSRIKIMVGLTVSVIICTYNRGRYLARCLDSIKKQTYPNYEIIIVNGPSNDDTEMVLQRYDNVKTIRQKTMNGLSFARNLGIVASKGDIIAFIDDDAVADKDWIRFLVQGYSDSSVGGVGGLVLSPDGIKVQFDNGVIDKCGISDPIRPMGKKAKPDEFNIFMGTNCSFRRSVIDSVGGFDPYFRYYHDESDLCVRIIKIGFKLVYSPESCVFHDMAEGFNRKSAYDLNWTEILKNVLFFTLKNFGCDFRSYTTRPLYSIYWWQKGVFRAVIHKRITLSEFVSIEGKVIRGIFRGYLDGVMYNYHRSSEKSDYLDPLSDVV